MNRQHVVFKKWLSTAAANNVYALEKRTKGNCPYMRVRSTGVSVDFVLAKGGKKGGKCHVYVTYWAEEPRRNINLGTYELNKIGPFIRHYGRCSPRDVRASLIEVFGRCE